MEEHILCIIRYKISFLFWLFHLNIIFNQIEIGTRLLNPYRKIRFLQRRRKTQIFRFLQRKRKE